MRLLLDTHAFLWFVWADPRLSSLARSLIQDPANVLYLSVASSWELAIKTSIGKLVLAQPLEVFLPDQIQRNSLQVLPISLFHTYQVSTLPLHHRDPFDRLMVAQSLAEALPLVSAESLLDQYGLQRLW